MPQSIPIIDQKNTSEISRIENVREQKNNEQTFKKFVAIKNRI